MDQGLQATRISAGGTYTACLDVEGESPYLADYMGKLKTDLKMYSRNSRSIKEWDMEEKA